MTKQGPTSPRQEARKTAWWANIAIGIGAILFAVSLATSVYIGYLVFGSSEWLKVVVLYGCALSSMGLGLVALGYQRSHQSRNPTALWPRLVGWLVLSVAAAIFVQMAGEVDFSPNGDTLFVVATHFLNELVFQAFPWLVVAAPMVALGITLVRRGPASKN